MPADTQWTLVYLQYGLLAVQVVLFVVALAVAFVRQQYGAAAALSATSALMAVPVCGLGWVVATS